MRPWLPDGTPVLIRPAASGDPCRAGDVLLLRLGEAWAVHRALRSVAGRAGPTRRGADRDRSAGLSHRPVPPKPPASAQRASTDNTLPHRAPPTRGDWTGVADPPAGAVLGRVAFARIGGRWRRADTGLARLAGLATGAIIAVVTRVGGRGLAAELRGRPRRTRRS
jgi:hypothetical protein